MMIPKRSRWIALAPLLVGAIGCAQVASRTDDAEVIRDLHVVAQRPPSTIPPDGPLGVALDPPGVPPLLAGPQPVDAYIRHALAENRMVQAARYNVLALKHRIPQVTALDDPVVSNSIFPSSANGTQTADGFMPWNLLIAQQFPWFGTLGLRGLAAEQDVQVALAELAAAQLDVVEAVKRAYHDLRFNEQAERLLLENRALVEDFAAIAQIRYETGQAGQGDLLMAEVMLTDLDRELLTIRQGITSARAELAQQLHITPEAELQTLPGMPIANVPDQIDRLYRLAVAARPELRGRLAAVARDATAVELARKRSYPDVTLGFNYGLMTTEGAVAPFAMGNDNLGLFVGFNLPIYRGKIDAAVQEAQARALADTRLYEAERDGAFRQIKDLMTQARAQRETLDLFRSGILTRARQALEIASADYQTGVLDFQTLITAWREVLQIELQIAQFEATLGQSLASLERAVGMQLSEHPIPPGAPVAPEDAPGPPPPPDGPGPFEPFPPGETSADRVEIPELP